jgi:N-hydroxyarylamine O-acetyltransferase
MTQSPFLEQYFQRIDYQGQAQPDLKTLSALQLGHSLHIPFENFNILLDQPILLDKDSLFEKLVRQQRGGYCFEMNGLLKIVLDQIGFHSRSLLARVLLGPSDPATHPQTHQILMVTIDDMDWLVDVGFGGGGPLLPLPMIMNKEGAQFAESFRIVPAGPHGYMLQTDILGQWNSSYSFTLESHYPPDFEVANHYTATSPKSKFTQTAVCNQPSKEGNKSIVGRELKIRHGQVSVSHPLKSDQDYLQALSEHFGIQLAAIPKSLSNSDK